MDEATHSAEATQREVGAEPHKPNFPPFDFTTFVPQLFWLAIAFTLLYVLLERVALPSVARAIEGRSARIKGDLDAAETARKDAEAALKAFDKVMGEARLKATEITGAARAAIKAEADKERTKVDGELAAQVEAAEARIAEARNRALSGVRGVAVEVAVAIVEKILRQRPSAAELGRAVDEELAA